MQVTTLQFQESFEPCEFVSPACFQVLSISSPIRSHTLNQTSAFFSDSSDFLAVPIELSFQKPQLASSSVSIKTQNTSHPLNIEFSKCASSPIPNRTQYTQLLPALTNLKCASIPISNKTQYTPPLPTLQLSTRASGFIKDKTTNVSPHETK